MVVSLSQVCPLHLGCYQGFRPGPVHSQSPIQLANPINPSLRHTAGRSGTELTAHSHISTHPQGLHTHTHTSVQAPYTDTSSTAFIYEHHKIKYTEIYFHSVNKATNLCMNFIFYTNIVFLICNTLF